VNEDKPQSALAKLATLVKAAWADLQANDLDELKESLGEARTLAQEVTAWPAELRAVAEGLGMYTATERSARREQAAPPLEVDGPFELTPERRAALKTLFTAQPGDGPCAGDMAASAKRSFELEHVAPVWRKTAGAEPPVVATSLWDLMIDSLEANTLSDSQAKACAAELRRLRAKP
jgi:hypothetical protein